MCSAKYSPKGKLFCEASVVAVEGGVGGKDQIILKYAAKWRFLVWASIGFIYHDRNHMASFVIPSPLWVQ